MDVCQTEGAGRIRITSLLQAVKKLRPHHKFDLFPCFWKFSLFYSVKIPTNTFISNFCYNEFNQN
jgi:hypothetical protein